MLTARGAPTPPAGDALDLSASKNISLSKSPSETALPLESRPDLFGLPQVPVLMSSQNCEAGVGIVPDPPIEGRGDPHPAQFQSIGGPDTVDLSSLEPVELSHERR